MPVLGLALFRLHKPELARRRCSMPSDSQSQSPGAAEENGLNGRGPCWLVSCCKAHGRVDARGRITVKLETD